MSSTEGHSESPTAKNPSLSLSFFGLIAAFSAIALIVLWNLQDQLNQNAPMLAHLFAGLCLGWTVFGWLLRAIFPRFMRSPRGQAAGAVLQMAVTACGLVTLIIMLYVGTTETILRGVAFSYEMTPSANIWPSGLIDLAVLAAATIISWISSRDHRLITATMWILIFAGFWLALRQPPYKMVTSPGGAGYAVLRMWLAPFLLSSGIILTIFTLVSSFIQRHRQERAWPDNLDDLITPLPPWPGFRYSAGFLGAIILIFGCVFAVTPYTAPAAMLAGISLLILANRQWEQNLADMALGLITLALVSLLMVFPPIRDASAAVYYAVAFNRCLIGLAIMAWFWHWLAGVWKQQLDHGKAWTTAGRLIRPCERVGFLIGCTAVLVSLNLSFWPRLGYVDTADTMLSRWIWGVGANILLILGLMSAARKSNKPTVAWLSLFAVASIIAFALSRSTDSVVAQWWASKWPITLAFFANLCIVLTSLAIRSKNSHCFIEPLCVSGLVLLPMGAIAGTMSIVRVLSPLWLPPATFLALAACYALAALLIGPRKLFILSGLCTVSSVVYWIR